MTSDQSRKAQDRCVPSMRLPPKVVGPYPDSPEVGSALAISHARA